MDCDFARVDECSKSDNRCKCNICSEIFYSYGQLNMHRRENYECEKALRCNGCNKIIRMFNIVDHIGTHLDTLNL